MEDRNTNATDRSAGNDSGELKDADLKQVTGGFNPQPDPPRERS